jgi:signal transduction histidine kinase
MIFAVIILAPVFVFCAALVFLLKRDIRHLNQTLREIEKSETNTRATTKTFDKSISELCAQINDILDKQKQTAIKSEKSNREFRQAITNISHDLRTPLTSAIGYMQMIKSGNTPDEKKREYFEIIENRLKSLSELMNELFEYTQIIEGRTAQNIEKINICNILRDIVSEYYGDFISKNFIVEIDIPDSPVYVLGDTGLIRRAAQNLILNVLAHGVKYFRLAFDGHDIIFQNKVTHPEEVEAERLFDRFYTADSSRSGSTTGLGLAIVKEIVQNMGGEVFARMENDMLYICVRLKKGSI